MGKGALLSLVSHRDARKPSVQAPAAKKHHASAKRRLPQQASVNTYIKRPTEAADNALAPYLSVGGQTPKPVAWWAVPFLAVADRAVTGVLRLRGYRHRTVVTSGGKLHAMACKGRGSMPPIVVVPGLGTRVGDYGLLLWRLKSKFSRVVAIDLPAHGKSQLRVPMDADAFARAIHDAKSQLVPEPSFTLGHSLGALGSITSYFLNPQDTLAMALVAPPGGPTPPALVGSYKRRFEVRTWRDASVIADMTNPRLCWPHLFSPAAIANRMRAPSVRALLRSNVLTTPPTPAGLASLPAHTMFVWAGRERLLPPEHRRYFLQHMPPTTRIWDAPRMGHGDIAWGQSKNYKPILRFFEGAWRDLQRDPHT